jgi:hypothetical protein
MRMSWAFLLIAALVTPASAAGGRRKAQWLKLLDMLAEIRAFIAANEAQLKTKE